VHRPRDVLDLLLAQILKDKGESIAHLIMDGIGDEHPAGIGQRFDPCGDVDAVAIEVVALNERLMPMRSSMRLSAAVSVSRSGIACCTSAAQRTASTTLANSTSRPSPVVLTMRPRCSAIVGSRTSRRSALRRSSVPSSSAPISREYPATSAAKIAARRRMAAIGGSGLAFRPKLNLK
jgi:hypothetical protein